VPNSEGSAGDYLHPNRAGYQAMGVVAANAVAGWLARTPTAATAR
jgi:lysophospholipase L1-like esterase